MSDIKQLTEKDLLILKGNALRLRFKAETNRTKKEIIQPFKQAKDTGLALVSSPVVKTAALNFMLKRLLNLKAVGISALGLAAFLLLQKKKTEAE